ncbi:MAG: hypothetical protein N3F05_01970 [Candidatus Diapherotrites archaeon]|nr:hypothetical protein [Candidatus Diapherotrites archaeon]
MVSVSGNTDITKLASRILIFLILVFVLLYVLTWTNTLKCKSLPGWCSVYYAIRGKPKVLIAVGDYGLGDPELLRRLMSNPRSLGVRPDIRDIDMLKPGNLKEYDLVIVERARKMSSEKVRMFVEYANQGGNLIWTGDSGAEAFDNNEFLYRDELGDSKQPHTIINPWARKHEDTAILLNELLSLEYVCNYKDIRGDVSHETLIGNLVPLNLENPFVYGISPSLAFYITPETDFAVVRTIEKGTSTAVMVLDVGSNITYGGKKYGKTLPFIVTNAKGNVIGLKIGENVAYYAMPPEYFMHESLPKERRYPTIVEKMFIGMLYG